MKQEAREKKTRKISRHFAWVTGLMVVLVAEMRVMGLGQGESTVAL